MMFFLDADENVYARYGGRCDRGPDTRQSLAGLRYTMESVLAMHARGDRQFAPRTAGDPVYVTNFPLLRRSGQCVHCHQVKEVLRETAVAAGTWTPDQLFRYPLPEKLGFALEIDRGNRVSRVEPETPAQRAGLQAGDVLLSLGSVPTHSFGDVQFALDRAEKVGSIAVEWKRGSEYRASVIDLRDGWRRSNISWRASMFNDLAYARVNGPDLSSDEKRRLGLAAERLAFRQQESVSKQAAAAGIQSGDVIVGIDDLELNIGVTQFLTYVRNNYVRGDAVVVNLIRDGMHRRLRMTLQ